MNEVALAGMLMSLAVVSAGMIWSQSREHRGKKSLSDSMITWIKRMVQ